MLVAVAVLLPIAFGYKIRVFRVLRGRVTLEEIRRHASIY